MNGKSKAREAIDFRKQADLVLLAIEKTGVSLDGALIPVGDVVEKALRSVAEQIEEETIKRLLPNEKAANKLRDKFGLGGGVERLYRSEGTEQASEGDK